MFTEKPATKKSFSKRKLVFGVGINDADYITGYKENKKLIRCPYYIKWTGMLMRCYNDKYLEKNPRYKCCSVCAEWLTFSKFRSWMELQDWIGKDLDKDLLYYNNKIYSPNTSMFIPKSVNLMLRVTNSGANSKYKGVSYCKQTGNYSASCRTVYGHVKIGRFTTPEEAEKKYNSFKRKIILELADEQTLEIKLLMIEFANKEYA